MAKVKLNKVELSAAELLQIKQVADSFNKLNKKLQLAFLDRLVTESKLAISKN